MRWFQFSVHDFEESQNPENCELVTMSKKKDSCGHAWLELEEKDRLSLCLPGNCGVPRTVQLHRLQRLYETEECKWETTFPTKTRSNTGWGRYEWDIWNEQITKYLDSNNLSKSQVWAIWVRATFLFHEITFGISWIDLKCILIAMRWVNLDRDVCAIERWLMNAQSILTIDELSASTVFYV